MIQICSNGETREAGHKSRDYVHPSLKGDRFAVVRVGPFWEVRCRTYRKGHKTSDQLVQVFESEREADAVACFLTTGGEAGDEDRDSL